MHKSAGCCCRSPAALFAICGAHLPLCIALQQAETRQTGSAAAHKKGNKRVKVAHEDDAFLVPVGCHEDLQTGCAARPHLLAASASNSKVLGAQAEDAPCPIVGQVGKGIPGLVELRQPESLHSIDTDPDQHSVLQAKGVAPNIVRTAFLNLKDQQVSDSESSLNALTLLACVGEVIDAAQQAAAEGLNVVAVHVEVWQAKCHCHLVCHHCKPAV